MRSATWWVWLAFAAVVGCGQSEGGDDRNLDEEAGAPGSIGEGDAGGTSSIGGRGGAGGNRPRGGATSTGGRSSSTTGGRASSTGSGGTATPADGGAAQAGADDGSAGEGSVERRLPVPCNAPIPTGYCFVSDSGDYIGGGKSTSASGEGSVQLQTSSHDQIGISLQNADNGDSWSVEFAAFAGQSLAPGLYDPAQRYPFQVGTAAGLSIGGNGRGCNTLTGRFSIEELTTDPVAGLTRFSATFEQHCEGGTSALRGVINLEATGTPDASPAPHRTIALDGKVFRIVYDPASDLAYGLDATNRRLAKIDLESGDVTYGDVIQVPNDGCVDVERQRLFVVNKGSSLITEYDTSDLSVVRDITWAGTDWGPSETRFKIYCAPETLYVVDGAWAPALFTVEGLDESDPVVTDHTAEVASIGGLALNAAATEIYYWYQYGWSAGSTNTSVHRLLASDLSEIDVSSDAVADFNRDPLDAPILLDEGRGLVFSKNKIFDSMNLEKLIYSLPSEFDVFDGAGENVYALDAEHGFFASKNYVYELDRYSVVAPTILTTANQLFFRKNGELWFLSVSKGALEAQVIKP